MKKLIIISLSLLFGLSAFAQEVAESNTVALEGANSTDEKVIAQVIRENRSKDFDHWMISVGGGFNLMLVERAGTIQDPIHSYRNNFQGAVYANFGYMINPIWGVIAEYGYIPINKKIFTPEGDMTGTGHEATIQLDFNILNLVRKCRKNTKWNVDALVGAGFLAYNTKYKLDTKSGEKRHYYYPAICIPVSLKFQYCPINELGIALRITGKWYSEDDVNYIWQGTGNHNNDMALYCGLELQYNVTTKDRQGHVRVLDRCTYEPMNVVLEGKIADVNKNTEQIQEMEDELEDLKDEVAILNGTADPEAVRARREARKAAKKQPTQTDVAQNASTPDNTPVNAGNAGNSPVAPVTPAAKPADNNGDIAANQGNNGNAPVVVYQQPVDMKKYDALFDDVDKMKDDIEYLRQQVMMSNGTDEYTVYFDFDKYVVKPEYQIIIAKVARVLLKDKSLKVELVSHCDKEGTVGYNVPLGQNRAEVVYNILVNTYKIEKSRISIKYDGQIFDEFDAFNRRTDIFFK